MGDRHAIRSRRVAAGPGSEGKMGLLIVRSMLGKAVRARLLRVGVEGPRGAENQGIYRFPRSPKMPRCKTKKAKKALAKVVAGPVESFPVKPGSMETP